MAIYITISEGTQADTARTVLATGDERVIDAVFAALARTLVEPRVDGARGKSSKSEPSCVAPQPGSKTPLRPAYAG